MGEVGQLIAGRYTLLDLIGRGGYANVFKAIDMTTREIVAVKLLQPGHPMREELSERLEREYCALNALQGTAAPRVFGLFSQGSSACLVMEYLTGKDFEDYLTAGERRAHRFSVSELVRLLDPIVETLERAHGLGIVHRDLKPANIFVVDPGLPASVRLLDFGLARVDSSRPITRDGVVIGSPSYIAPEVWGGRTRALDHRIDVYSLGAIIFRALAGRVPFFAEDMKKRLEMVTTAERPSLHRIRPDLPERVDEWTRQALAIDPEERFARVGGMWNALLSTLGVHAPSARLTPITAP